MHGGVVGEEALSQYARRFGKKEYFTVYFSGKGDHCYI